MTQKEVAIAILYQGDRVLFQLRDRKPNIIFPGHWGLFGGHLEPGESPEVAVYRELQEEIGLHASNLKSYGQVADPNVRRYVFYGPLTCPIHELVQTEGFDMALLNRQQVVLGRAYSAVGGCEFPLVPTIQPVVQAFLESLHALG
jgi:8-oxo-dGTP pyrophosphatase MutT (NUDIX family)